MHAQRGDSVCKNSLLIRRQELERQLLAGLQERVLHPDVVRYTLKRFEEELEKALAARRQGDADRRRQEIDLERKIANQLRGLSDGYSRLITEEIARLEYQLNSLRDRLQASAPGTAKLQMRDTRRFVESRLRDLIMEWRPADRARGDRETRAKNYAETGSSDLRRYWRVGLAWSTGKCGCYGGAGGPDRTRRAAFSIPLAA